MKVLRRSLKTDREKPSISVTPKSAIAIIPPKKVIRALYDYEAQSREELSFQKGDFFHVIGRENDSNWYEACNPAVPDARGLVPVAYFQSLGKTERDSTQSDKSSPPVRQPDHDSGYSDHLGTSINPSEISRTSNSMGKVSGAMVYGIVMYDFVSERPDELDAKAGEAIIVIAQSNPEWFVAKPIGRLGGPGLIPVSFIEIRDMVTGQVVPDALEAVQKARVPKVEEWKRMAADYKNSSISLGKFEVNTMASQQKQQMEQGIENMSLQSRKSHGIEPNKQIQTNNQAYKDSYASRPASSIPAAISARIPRYCFAEDKYWFVVEVKLEDGKYWELSRYYEDFYDFQIQLLSEFPVEAGNTGQQTRTLPYMPGPVSYVTDAITEGRQINLNAYVKTLLAQPAYISRCQLVREFFVPREGDYEIDPETANEEYRLSAGSQPSSSESAADSASRLSCRENMNSGTYSYSSLGPPHNSGPMAETLSAIPDPQQTMKVKIYFRDDLIAIRVPREILFDQLSDKIRERLKIPPSEGVTLSYKDEGSGQRPLLMNNDDLDLALRRNDKFIVYVE